MAVTAASVRALEGAIKRPYTAGGTITVGNAVYVDSSGTVQATDANAAASVEAIGIAVAGSDRGETSIESGDAVTVVTYGPVGGFSSLNEGVKQYVSETAGAITETAPSGGGNWVKLIGYAESASILFVNPEIADGSSTA